MAWPSQGTASRRIWDAADRLSQELGRPAARAEVCPLAELHDIHPKTVSTQYGRWKRHTYPELDGMQYRPHTMTSPPQSAAPVSKPEKPTGISPETDRGWALLLKNGFSYLGDWHLTEAGSLTLENPAPKEPGVYAFVLEEEVVYVGKTEKTLHARLAAYRHGYQRQRTNNRLKSFMINALTEGKIIRVFYATPPDTEWKGLPVITFHGLEAGLIKYLTPRWNIQGKG